MNFLLCLLLSTTLAAFALWKKSMTPGGTLLAWLLCLWISYEGGLPAFLILAVTFLLVIAAGKLAGKRSDPYNVRKKNGARDAWRVLCNVGVAACALIPYALWKDHRFLYVYAAVMAESLADSLASKAGPLTRYATVDICTFRKISPGLSGGVSLLGTLSGLLGACIIAVLCTGFPTATLKIAATVAMTGFAGCLFDSVLGSVVQVKYLCTVCGMLVERDMHCGTAAIPCRGVRFITNDAVNILSNFFTFLLAAAVL